MNTPLPNNLTNTADKCTSADGDGIKHITPIRHPVPSSKKFTTKIKKTKNLKSQLELALEEMKSVNKNQGLRGKRGGECSSVDSPFRIRNRKCLKSAEDDDKIEIYCSPRKTPLRQNFPKSEARLVLSYLLMNSWRKSRSRCGKLSSLHAVTEDKVKQLHIQVDVLQNLRKSESLKREEIALKYSDIQKNFDEISWENITLKKHIECLDKDKFGLISELKEINSKSQYYQQEIQEKTNSLNLVTEKFEKETEKVRKTTAENKIAQEQNYKLESTINMQKEKIDNLKSCVETLQKSKIDLNSKWEKSQEICKQHSEQLRALILEKAKFKSKISDIETDKKELYKELQGIQKQLEIALKQYNDLKVKNESIEIEIQDLSLKYEEERKFLWKYMRNGVFSTYSILKYLAEKIVPALQSNFSY